jgi:hypothetical protein
MSNRALTMDTVPVPLIGTCPEAVKRWLTGAAQRLQEMKNLEIKTGSTSLAGKDAIHEDVRRQWEKECHDAMNQEIEVKCLFSSRTKGVLKWDRRPTKEKLLQQSEWVVAEMGPDRNF